MYEIVYKDVQENEKYEEIVKKVLEQCFKEEDMLDSKLYITITFTTPQNIKEINKKYRNIDKATDVLSFPMCEKDELETKIKNKDYVCEDVLGDIIISIEKVQEQAEEYGHGLERELSFLAVHGFYHLLGYDHQTEEEAKIMFGKQEEVLEKYGITRKK